MLRNAIVRELVYDDIAKLCAAQLTYLHFPTGNYLSLVLCHAQTFLQSLLRLEFYLSTCKLFPSATVYHARGPTVTPDPSIPTHTQRASNKTQQRRRLLYICFDSAPSEERYGSARGNLESALPAASARQTWLVPV